MDLYLAYRMGATGGVVGLGGMGSAYAAAEGYQIKDLFLGLHELFLESVDLDLLLLVLQYLELLVIVEEIVDLASVYLIHADCDCEVPLVVLEVGNAPVE